MRLIFDISTKVAKGILDYIAESSTEPEVIVKIRLLHRTGKPQAPHILWELEFLPNNGGIYKMLLEGGRK